MVAGDITSLSSHHVNMAASGHDWYLREWFETQGLKQNDLVTKLDYPKNTANRLWHSVQPYRRDFVEAVADLLNIAPFELLMPPADAMALRRLRSAIAEVASTERPAEDLAEPVSKKTGTAG